MSNILLSEKEIISLFDDAENIRLYFKVMRIRKDKKIGGWKIARMLNEWNKRQRISRWLYTQEKPRGVKSIDELKKAKLCPLRVSDSKTFSHLMQVLGYRYADGCIYYQKNNRSYTFYLCSANEKDVQKIVKDCKDIWNMDLKYHRGTDAYYIYIPAGVARLVIALGSPVGRKTSQIFKIPKWVFNLSNNLKWEFIGGLFSGDGSVPKLQPGLQCSSTLRLSLNSEKKIANGFSEAFMKDVWLLLKQLGIRSSKPKVEWNSPKKSKTGIVTHPVSIRILTEKENMISFLKNVRYRYSANCFKGSREVLDVLEGGKEKAYLKDYLSNPVKDPPRICVFLGQPEQRNLIEKAANKISGENKKGAYTTLAKHLYSKCKNVNSFDFLLNKYLSDWKYRDVFIPIDYVVELARLCEIEVPRLEKSIKQVKFIRTHNKFAISCNS